MLRLILLHIFALLLNYGMSAQLNDSQPAKKYQKDLDMFMEIIDVHPEPYQYHSQEEFDSLYTETAKIIEHGTTNLEFYKQLCKLAALINDGHTRAVMPANWIESLSKTNGILPLEFHLTNDNELYVIKSFNEENQALKGCQVLEINGIEINDLIAELNQYISYERLPFRNIQIQDGMEYFLYLLFGGINDLTFKCKKASTFDHTVVVMPEKEAKIYKKTTRDKKEELMAKGKPYHFEKLGDGVGYLAIYRFKARDIEKYKIFLINVFKEIEKENIDHLVLDVRENLGGWPKISSLLFHYISDTHFKTLAYSETKVSQIYKNELQDLYKRYGVVSLNAHQYQHSIDLRSIVTEPTNSVIREEAFYNEMPEEKTNEYDGYLYLLTDRKSYSASACFAATFKCYQLGTIIGEETGGTNIFYANSLRQELFNTNIIFSVSTVKDFTTCFDIDNPHHGITPNIPFTPSVIDELNEFDSQLNFTKMVIRKVKKQVNAAANGK